MATGVSDVSGKRAAAAARKKRLCEDMLSIIERNVSQPPLKCTKRTASETQMMSELAAEQDFQAEERRNRTTTFTYTPRKHRLETSIDQVGSTIHTVHSSATSNSQGEQRSTPPPSHSKLKPVFPGLRHHRYAQSSPQIWF